MNDLRAQFEKHAISGYLGDPNGEDSYAYMRASSERQTEEGSSFTRQIETIHRTALREMLRISFDMIFFDDGYSGFEFEHRPALLKLRYETRSEPRAFHLVIEDIDRLSRNADWQQGFLLEEFYRNRIKIHFHINPGSALERYIRGFMAQEEMKKARERMRMGNIYKAMSGKVTAKRPRYGYLLNNDSGYEFHPEESKVMRMIYEMLLYKGWHLSQIAQWLNDRSITTRFKGGLWTAATVHKLVKSPVYKGDFYANRHQGVKTGEHKENGKPKSRMIERPVSEWIHIPVPAIVTQEEWENAQKVMTSNAKKSMRNAQKHNWLLTGLMKCGICRKYSYIATLGNTPKTRRRYYKCISGASERARVQEEKCFSPYVHAELLERRVWEAIETLIYDPNVILQRLEQRSSEDPNKNYKEQISFIDEQVIKLDKEQQKYEAAYERDIYTLNEFEEKMMDLKQRRQTLRLSRTNVEAKIAESISVDEQKQVALKALMQIKATLDSAKKGSELHNEIPFDLKRKILSLLVEVIWVDSRQGCFTIEGEITGTFDLDRSEDSVLSAPVIDVSFGDFAFPSSRRWQ